MAESIDVTPNWPRMREWVQHVYKTDPETARKIAAGMGEEAPELPEQEEQVEWARICVQFYVPKGLDIDSPLGEEMFKIFEEQFPEDKLRAIGEQIAHEVQKTIPDFKVKVCEG